MVNKPYTSCRERFLHGDVQYLLGGILSPLRAIPITSSNMQVMRVYCTVVRNFKNTSLRTMIKRTSHLNGLWLEHFKRFWVTLKFIQDLEPSMKSICYMFLRNAWDIDWQIKYKDTIEFLSGSFRYYKNLIVRTDFKDLDKYNIYLVLKEVSREFWLPLSVFFRYDYKAEGKFSLSFLSLKLKEDRLQSFEKLVIKYIQSLGLKDLFTPPSDVCLKATSSRYNDGGDIRRDFELPKKSFDCGFLYQSFNPKPLATREVWLPDKSTKINNSYWMIVGRQFLKMDPTYPRDDPRETWELIKDKLQRFLYFDISGFGLQFPRPLIAVVATVISRLYPSVDNFEQTTILHHILDNVIVQMPSKVEFKYPPRGIGLGYYEDLKTIVINSILYEYDRISVYGDQGLIKGELSGKAIFSLAQHEFYMKPGKHKNQSKCIQWSGWTMTPEFCQRPKLTFEPIVSLFSAEYHWERKRILESFMAENPNLYYKWDKKISFLYELFFGYEFTKGDSLWNFRNGGVSIRSPEITGSVRTWRCQRMKAPSDEIKDGFLYESPFYCEWKRADAKAYSIKRKNAYKYDLHARTEIIDYAQPKIRMNKTKSPVMDHIARCVSDFFESKLIVNHLMTTGKITFGLNAEDLFKSLRQCSLARNPYEAYATGGYSIETVWRSRSLPSREWVELTELITTKLDYLNKYKVSYLNTYIVQEPVLWLAVEGSKAKRRSITSDPVIDSSKLLTPTTKEMVKKIKFNQLSSIALEDDHIHDDRLESGTLNIRDDIGSRQLVDPDVLTVEVGDEDMYLDDFLDTCEDN